MMCTYDGCDNPVHAVGKCQRHYWRDYKREQAGTDLARPTGAGRPAMDERVYKIRFQLPYGGTNTKHYSDPKVAERHAEQHRKDGTLLLYASYKLEQKMVDQ